MSVKMGATVRHLGVERLITENPAGPKADQGGQEFYRALRSGQNPYRRAEQLHQMLSGEWGPERTYAVDNGAGSLPHLAMVLAAMGSRVTVKEPDASARMLFSALLSMHATSDIRYRVWINDRSFDDIIDPQPSQIVYWSNPQNLIDCPSWISIPEFLGRDVMKGGFLVIQTDHMLAGNRLFPNITNDYLHLDFDPLKWETIHRAFVTQGPDKFVLPTYQTISDVFLQIYQRKTEIYLPVPFSHRQCRS